MPFLKFHILLSFWAAELRKVLFNYKFLTDYLTGCNSISATWSFFFQKSDYRISTAKSTVPIYIPSTHSKFSYKASYTLIIFRISQYFATDSTKHMAKSQKLTIHLSAFVQISWYINAIKNNPWSPLMFHENANCGTKCCKMQKTIQNAEKWPKVPSYTHLGFCTVSCYFVINV